MPLRSAANGDVPAATNITTLPNGTAGAYLTAGNLPCIGVHLVNKVGNTPAHIILTRNTTNNTGNSVCQQVLASQAVTDYFNSRVGTTNSAIPVSSSRGIYRPAGE